MLGVGEGVDMGNFVYLYLSLCLFLSLSIFLSVSICVFV